MISWKKIYVSHLVLHVLSVAQELIYLLDQNFWHRLYDIHLQLVFSTTSCFISSMIKGYIHVIIAGLFGPTNKGAFTTSILDILTFFYESQIVSSKLCY